jgi:serine phosphatase RsbU (regulator of sigma subunit)
MGLRARFSLWMALFVILAMGGVNLFFILRENNILSQQIRLRGETIARNVALNAEDPLGNENDLLLSSLVYDTEKNNEGVVYCLIMDAEKRLWASTSKFTFKETYVPPATLSPLRDESILVQPFVCEDGEEVYDIAVPIKIKDTIIGEVHLGISRDAIKRSIKETGKGMISITAVTLIGGILGILFIVRFIVGSIGRITDDIEAIGNGDLEREIVVWRRDEIGRIAKSVKEMAVKLKDAQRELIEKERMKKEMQIAREIQQTLLPQSLPEIPEFQLTSYYESAKEVGGDYFDLINIDKDRFGIVVADVSGKGVASSLIMTMVRSIMRREVLINPSPHGLLSLTNYMLMDDIPDGMFITIFYVMVHIASGELSFACAGHNPALHYRAAEQRIQLLKPRGPAIGIPLIDEKGFARRLKEDKVRFKQGDVLFLYTDGITEAMNSRDEQFGEERIISIMKQAGNLNVFGIKEQLLVSLKNFTGGTPQSDDITFVLLKRE